MAEASTVVGEDRRQVLFTGVARAPVAAHLVDADGAAEWQPALSDPVVN
jgi:hypothetical protein